MTLEDFFTISKVENGLTTPDRVNELITKMQSEKDLAVNSFGQTTRQLSKVATIIAATENKDCLDLFIQLNGLLFIEKWLKDAQKLNDDDDENSFVEELIISLLRALEKLQIDDKSSFSSGIMQTVQDLVANNNHTVRVKAKELCDNWMLVQDKNKILQDTKDSDNMESRPPNYSMDLDAKNQESVDRVEPSSKSMNDEDNGESNSKSEGVWGSDVKNENEINFGDRTDKEMSTLSCPSEHTALIAQVDNSLESCIKTNALSDKDGDVTNEEESPKTSSNSDRDSEAGNTIVGCQNNGNSENGSSSIKFSINTKKSDMKLDYGMIDPLDIARQVAIEVEREADSPERSCSTSEKSPDVIKRPNTPDSKNGQEIQSQSQSQSQKQLVGGSDKEVLPKPVKDAETLVSQISEVAQDSEPNTGRPFSGFDLNQEVCSEEIDNLDSRAPAAAQMPASTSVCRDVLQGPGTHNKSNQQSDFHDFDLNVAEGGQEDKMVIVPGLPSGEESSIANPRKPERLQWDLNSIVDDQNGGQSPYHASSSSSWSSSSRKPILRNIDLNLNDQAPNSDDSVISIFGTRVEVEKNEHKPQPDPKFDFNHGRHLDSSMHYSRQNAMFCAMPMYGSSHGVPMHTHMPFMVDSRGTPFVPQIVGSQSSSPSPSPFFMNLAAAGAPPPLLPPQHNFDLNTGVMINGGLRQFFPQKVNEHASSSSVLGKRHEPDSNWQFFPVNKHQQPQWR